MKKLIGYCAVDSGQLIITDPCYLGNYKNNEFNVSEDDKYKPPYNYDYNGCSRATCSKNRAGQLNDGRFDEVGVAVSTGYGDGCYPVYATYNRECRIIKVEVIFSKEGV